MRNRFYITLLLLIVFEYLSFAENTLIGESDPAVSGTIITNQSEPVIGAHIAVQGTLIGTITDLNGKFELYNIKPGEYTLIISALGFRTFSKSIDILDNSSALVNITIDQNEFLIPEVLITGKSDRLFSKIPGSASFINSKEIGQINPISGNEILRRSPGVHVVDEEGAGMRINVGIRGLDPDRSRSMLVLEDGIPVALAPYGE